MTQREEDVVLEEYDDSAFKQAMSETLKYPCILIEGVESEEELSFFKQRQVNPEYGLPFYCVLEDVPFEIGQFELSFDSLLSLRVIFSYKLWLLKSPDEKIFIDLNNPAMLFKFIKL